MTRTNPVQLSFASGEVSPLLYARTDYQRTQTGLRECAGFLPSRQGPITRAPGTTYLGGTDTGSGAIPGGRFGRLIGFQFAVDDSVVLEFTSAAMRVWRYGALVMDGAEPYRLVTPYNAAAIRRMKFVQAADVIYLVDGVKPMQRLARLALDNWTIGDADVQRGPFGPQNVAVSRTITPSAAGGSITLVGTGSPFVPEHVGGLFLFEIEDDRTGQWTPAGGGGIGTKRRYDGNYYEWVSGTNDDFGSEPPIHTRGDVKYNGDGPVWRFLSGKTGIARVTAYTNANLVTATVTRRIPEPIVEDGTYRWSEGAWSDKNGYPSAIAIHDQRLVAAATTAEPRTLWFSTLGAYLDFEPGTDDDQSFAYTIGGLTSLNRILWIQPGSRGLHVGALGEEHSWRKETGTITPASVNFQLDSTVGSLDAQPIVPDGKPIFIARDGGRVFELRFDFAQDQNASVELSLPAEHLGVDGFGEIAWQSAPSRLAWLTRSRSGIYREMCVLLHDAAEEVLGWARLPMAGARIESVCVTRSEDGSRDVVTLLVERTVGGASFRMVEEVAPAYGSLNLPIAIGDAHHLYSAVLKTDAVAFTTVAGLDHLEGSTVYCWTEHGELGPLVVDDGAVALPYPVNRALVGLFDATHRFETLDLYASLREGSSLGRLKRSKKLGLRWHRTAAGLMRTVEREFGKPDVVGEWIDVAQSPAPADLVAGFSGVLNVDAPTSFGIEVSFQFKPVGGAPMTLMAIASVAEASGG